MGGQSLLICRHRSAEIDPSGQYAEEEVRGAVQERPGLDYSKKKKTVAGKTNTAEQAQGNGGGGNTKRHLGSLEEKDTWVDSPVGMKGFHGKDGYRTYNMAC